MQSERTVDDNANNYAIAQEAPVVPTTPSKALARSSSIKYVNDDEPIYFNETPSYPEPTAYYEQPGKLLLSHLKRTDKNSTFHNPSHKLW